jgi:hypothetical protein
MAAGAGIVNTSTWFNSNSLQLRAAFIKNVKEAPPLYTEIFNVYPPDMKRGFWTVLPIIDLGPMAVKPEGTAPVVLQPGEGTPTTFFFSTYGAMYIITEEAELEDSQNIVGRMPGMLAASERYTKENLFAGIINFGFSSLAPIFDGQPLFSASHQLQGAPSVTQSNSLGATALTPDSLNNMQVLFNTWLSDAGNPLSRSIWRLIVHPNLLAQSEVSIGSPAKPYTSNNDKNPQYGIAEPFGYRYQTSQTQWTVIAPKGPLEGDSHSMGVSYKWQNRQRTWYDDPSSNVAHKSTFRTAFGSIDWRGAASSQGST